MTAIDSGIDALAPVDGLAVSLADGVLSVTIDRPDSLNSLTLPVFEGLADAMEQAANDPRVKVVRLGGAGRGFCSGAGMSADDVAGAGPVDDLIQAANRVARAITALPRPVVAVVHGPAAGVGVSIALACDLVLASDTAFFMLAFTKIGLMPDGGASALIAAAIGRIGAMRMAGSRSASNAIRIAAIRPIAVAISAEAPPSGIRPILVNASMKNALSEANTRSQAKAMETPTPAAAPCTTATTGRGSTVIARTTRLAARISSSPGPAPATSSATS